MATRDLFTFDLRGLRPALDARAVADGVPPSKVVRNALEAHLEPGEVPSDPPGASKDDEVADPSGKLTLRVPPAAAKCLAASAKAANMSQNAYMAALISDIPAVSDGGALRVERMNALVASSSELAAINRTLIQLHRTFKAVPGQPMPAELDAQLADAIAAVRVHLEAASGLLADLRPRNRFAVRREDVRASDLAEAQQE